MKRNIKFDDRNDDLMMDIKLPTSATWHNITIEQAREARKTRDAIDMQNIRQTALGGATAGASDMDREKARALMLSISPGRNGNFLSTSGVVHINSTEDWRNFEADDDNASDKSLEELLRGSQRNTRGRSSNTQGSS